jgi:transcriptional regulator with XRE-family HTH domain
MADDRAKASAYHFGNMGKPPRIGPKKPLRHYMAEWREHRGLTQQQLGDRLGVGKDTVSRWENDRRGISLNVLGAVAEALDVPPVSLYRRPAPDSTSPEDLLAGAPEQVRQEAAVYIDFLIRKHAG